MNNEQTENSKLSQLSFIDLWRVLVRYYYVIFIATGISLGSALFYIQDNSGKLRYISKAIIESSSYYGINEEEYYQKFLPFTNGVLNTKFLELFFSGGIFNIEVVNANRFMNIEVSSLLSAKKSLDILSSYKNFLQKEQENLLKNRRIGFLAELSLVETRLNNVNSKLLSIYALEEAEKNSITEIDEKVIATEEIIKQLEQYGNQLNISLDSISLLRERALQLINSGDNLQTPFIQEMILGGLLDKEKNSETNDNLFQNLIKVQDYKLELIELNSKRNSMLNIPDTAFGDSLSRLKANPDDDWEIYMDRLRQSQLDLEKKKSQLEYLSNLENQTNLRFYSEIEQTIKPATLHSVIILFFSMVFGLTLGIVLAFILNLLKSFKAIKKII